MSRVGSVNASAKLLKCDSMTIDKAHHVVSNDEGVRELSALNVERTGCIGKSKEALIKATRGSKKGVKPCIERGMGWRMIASNEGTTCSNQRAKYLLKLFTTYM